MGIIRNFLVQFKKKYVTSSNKRFVSYLQKKGVEIGEKVVFRYPQKTTIDLTRPYLVKIGNYVDINDNFTIMTHDFGTFVFLNLYHDFVPSSGRVKIGNNVYIGRDVTIMKGVEIGDNCIIGLGSVITKNIPSNSVACGIPCRVVCTIEEYYERRKIKSVNESIQYYKEIRNKRKPKITDMTEEWALFFRKNDFLLYPEMKKIILPRLKSYKDTFFDNRQLTFDGWDDFCKKAEL